MAKEDELPHPTSSPEAVSAWWTALDPARRAEYLADPPTTLGALDGLPAEVRDTANRAALDRYIAETDDPSAIRLRDSVGATTDDPRQRGYLLLFQPPTTVGATDALAAVSIGRPLAS